MKFFQFIVTHPKPKSRKICLIFKKRGNTFKKFSYLKSLYQIHYIREPYHRGFKLQSSECGISHCFFFFFFFFFFQKKHRRCMFICCFFFFFFFSRGDCNKPKVQDNWEEFRSNVNLKLFLSDHTDCVREKSCFLVILGHQTTTLPRRVRILQSIENSDKVIDLNVSITIFWASQLQKK